MSKKSTPTVRTYIRYANDRRTQPTHLVVVRREIPGGPHRAACVELGTFEYEPNQTNENDLRVGGILTVHTNRYQAGEFDFGWRIGADFQKDTGYPAVDKDFLSSTYLHRRCIPIELSTEQVMRLCPALAQWAWPEMGAQPVGNTVNFDKVPANQGV